MLVISGLLFPASAEGLQTHVQLPARHVDTATASLLPGSSRDEDSVTQFMIPNLTIRVLVSSKAPRKILTSVFCRST